MPVNAPVLAVSAAGTGDFAQALALAETGAPAGVAAGNGATADLDPAKPVAAGDPLPPVRQFLAASGDLAIPASTALPTALPNATPVGVPTGQPHGEAAPLAIPFLAVSRHAPPGDGDPTPVERDDAADPIEPAQPTLLIALPIVGAAAAVLPPPELVATAVPVSTVQPTASRFGGSIPNLTDKAAPQNGRQPTEGTTPSADRPPASPEIFVRPASDNPPSRLVDLGGATRAVSPPPPIASGSPASIQNRADEPASSQQSSGIVPAAVPQTARLSMETTGPAADRPAANPIIFVRPVSASAQPSSPERVAAVDAPIQASPPIPTPIPTPPTAPVIGVAVPALRAFAAGIAATTARPPRLLRDEEPLAAPLAPTSSADSAAQRLDPAPRALPPIDMRREDWTRALIDRIGAVHDVANARDTRITLVPDALGKIEVALRQDGDTVHVQFAADAPATRALLADAQPRLAELAEARGLRLGDASVSAGSDGARAGNASGGGFGQAADQRRPAPFAQPVNHNRSITTNPARDRADSDHRIA
ncbi:MAG: hypothetical protein BVN32_06705 [Proteobacteria bacterium ST_bin14]|nr:MAG: hypothetical protein BVN32_06705 [Proteobacteria bacterium ST_bin14]